MMSQTADRYADRAHAGRRLAAALREAGVGSDVVVLALPRGGVPVAAEVARALRAPMDAFLVRKLGVPGHEELAMGAIASGGVRFVNEEVVTAHSIPEEVVEAATVREQRELDRRERELRHGRPPPEVRGRRVVVVDDGLATGSTMHAAVNALDRAGAADVLVAVPVAPADTVAAFEPRIVCPLVPADFQAVGLWYEDFRPPSESAIAALLSPGSG